MVLGFFKQKIKHGLDYCKNVMLPDFIELFSWLLEVTYFEKKSKSNVIKFVSIIFWLMLEEYAMGLFSQISGHTNHLTYHNIDY